MPICTTCTYPTTYLYTVYESAHNLRLEQCCHAFVDPYVEHDSLVLLLDLILLKRGVYRHLLYNRGYPPRRLIASDTPAKGKEKDANRTQDHDATAEVDNISSIQQAREKDRRMTILQIGFASILIDAFIRWSHLHPFQLSESNAVPSDPGIFESFPRIFAGCLIETLAFHTGITMACAIVLKALNLIESMRKVKPITETSSIRNEFRKVILQMESHHSLADKLPTGELNRLSHVPLTLLYSSFTKLFLLLLLSIWRPSHANTASDQLRNQDTGVLSNGSDIPSALLNHRFIHAALQLFDKDVLDHEWVVRNLLGGMSAGFGLRVALDIHPIYTTAIILTGWGVKTLVASQVHPWVGTTEKIGDVFLRYSIP